MRKGFLAAVFLTICLGLSGQQTMNNESVIKLIKAGLADDLVVATINAQPGAYDVSPEGLSALKTGGADDKIIAALLAKAASAATSNALPAAPVDGMATVHIYRYKQYVGSALRPSIFCDDESQGRLSNGTFIEVQVKPGDHTFYADDKQAGAEIKIEAGHDYYLRADVATGFWKGHFRLTMMMPEQGKFDLAKLKPVEKEPIASEAPSSR